MGNANIIETSLKSGIKGYNTIDSINDMQTFDLRQSINTLIRFIRRNSPYTSRVVLDFIRTNQGGIF